ncbi:MAG: MATE family efflux transporter [Planctomycetota bacterium]
MMDERRSDHTNSDSDAAAPPGPRPDRDVAAPNSWSTSNQADASAASEISGMGSSGDDDGDGDGDGESIGIAIGAPPAGTVDPDSGIGLQASEAAVTTARPPGRGLVGWWQRFAEPSGPPIRSGRLAGKSLPAAILIVALPILLEQLANVVVGLVDVTLAGHLPEDIVRPALDGVGAGSYLRWFMGITTSAVGIGGMALISRATGADRPEEARRALGQTAMLSLVFGVAIGVILWVMVEAVVRLVSLEGQAAEFCREYVRIIAVGLPPATFMFATMMCLRGAGETSKPFYVVLVVNAVNIVVSWILCGADLELSLFGRPIEQPWDFNLAVAGIAWGTVAGYCVGAALMALLLIRGVRDLKLEAQGLRPDLEMQGRIVKIGIPSFFEGTGMWMGHLIASMALIGVISEVMEARGEESSGLMGAHIVAIQWESVSFMPGFALGIAAGSIAGQFLGAGNPQMARRAILACAATAMTFMTLAGVVFIFAGEWLTRIITEDDEQILEIAPDLLMICGFVQTFFALGLVLRQALRSLGDTRTTLVLTLCATYGIRVPLTWLFGYFMGFGIHGLWIGACTELALTGLIFLARFLQGKWMHLKV